MQDASGIDFVLFDFGGVIAEEGFKAGVKDIAIKNGLDPEGFKKTAFAAVYECGFTTGRVREDALWDDLRRKTGISGSDEELTETVLAYFKVRPYMIETVKALKQAGRKVCILSDQTHWLDELDRRQKFFHLFDRVFNSFDIGMTKKEPELFDYVLEKIKAPAEKTLFIDDHLPHIQRAQDKGIRTIFFTDRASFFEKIRTYFPFIDMAGK